MKKSLYTLSKRAREAGMIIGIVKKKRQLKSSVGITFNIIQSVR